MHIKCCLSLFPMAQDTVQNSSIELVDNHTNTQQPLRRNTFNFGGKKACITISIIIVVSVWLGLLAPIIVLVVNLSNSRAGSGMLSTTRDLYTSLPAIINASNYTNLTIKYVECVENFVYVSGEEICYPSCDWSPVGERVARNIQVSLAVLDILSLAFGSATLMVWVMTSCVDWKKLRLHYNFQLPRTSLFMVIICSLLLILTNTSVDVMNHSILFCDRNQQGVPFLRAETVVSASKDANIRFITNLLGALGSYLYIANLCWILFSLINILVIIYYPNLRERFRKRIMVFAFQCFVSFGLNLIPIAITFATRPESAYTASYIAYYIIIFNQWVFVFLFIVPSVVLPCLVISLVVLIVAKMRINSFQSKEITGTPIKLTDLEKRLIGYSTFLMLLLFLYGIIIILLSLLADEYFDLISQFILCITVNSPIIATHNATGTNSTVTLYRENAYGGVDTCRELEANAIKKLPFFIPTLLMFYLRLIWTPIFIVIVPHISPRSFVNMVRSRSILSSHKM